MRLVRLGRQQLLDAALHAVAPSLALLQLLLQVEAHQVLAADDTDDTVGHVDNGQVAQTERAEDHVGTVERELFLDVQGRPVHVWVLQPMARCRGYVTDAIFFMS